VTGVRDDLALEHDRLLSQLQALKAPPAVLGFGISTPEHVRQALESGAAGVISGSAIVNVAKDGPDVVRKFVAEMKAATIPLQPARASA